MEVDAVPHPVAIGGLGGSGTRAFATLLKLNGYYIGADLNEAEDNLWFTLLFKRGSILVETAERFRTLSDIFFAAMQGDNRLTLANLPIIRSLAEEDRLQHGQAWLEERIQTLISCGSPKTSSRAWGWKEPNTHVIIDRFLQFNDKLKYIHVLRNPYYMAQSSNQNQMENWGPVFFSRDVLKSSRNALRFWRLTHERAQLLEQTWPDRVRLIWYEDLMENPTVVTEYVARFLGIKAHHDAVSRFLEYGGQMQAMPSITKANLSEFYEKDVIYADRLLQSRGFCC